ncbi:hypothetical protein LUZ60_001921 [Juncus effusus]|nr:hypothetical protein LUZ60_001921 [Juncus effusus]
MSVPFEEYNPPPAPTVEVHRSNSASSFGPLIAVLAVITVLGALAVLVGRICFGRTGFRYGRYDLEAWIETKCASCVDGRIDVALPRPRHVAAAEPPPQVPPVAPAPAETPATPPPAAEEKETES